MHTQDESAAEGRRPLRRALCLGLYLGLLTLLAGFVVAQRASAELSERTLAIGRQLDAFQAYTGRVSELSWNGQTLAVSTAVLDLPLDEALARFVALCTKESGSIADELSAKVGGGALATTLLQRALVLRDRFEDGTGTSVCFSGLGAGGLSGLSQRVQSFARSGDLAELGQLRFARFRTTSEGRTHILMVLGDGPLRLDRLIPAEGRDAEGDDVIPGVRPLASTRLLSARTRGTPHGIAVYRSQLSYEAALADFDARLRGHGYERLPIPSGRASDAPARAAPRTEAYRSGPSAFVVTSQPEQDGSLLSVVQIAAQEIPAPNEAAEVGRSFVGRGRLGAPRDPAFE